MFPIYYIYYVTKYPKSRFFPIVFMQTHTTILDIYYYLFCIIFNVI